MAKTNKQGKRSAAGEKLLAQGTSGHSVESCSKGGLFAIVLSQSDQMELRVLD